MRGGFPLIPLSVLMGCHTRFGAEGTVEGTLLIEADEGADVDYLSVGV